MTKWELRQYRNIINAIEALKAEEAEVIQLIKAPDGMPRGSGTSDPTAKAGGRLAALSAERAALMDSLCRERKRIEKCISQLSRRDYLIMYRHYILGQPWEAVAESMHYSVRQILRIHGEILLRIRNK